jgi:hypothetical protein
VSGQNGNGRVSATGKGRIEQVYAAARRASAEWASTYGKAPHVHKVAVEDRPTKEQAWQAWCSKAMEHGEPIDREAFERWWRAEA